MDPLYLPLHPYARRSCAVRFAGRPSNSDQATALLITVHAQATATLEAWNLGALDGITLTPDLKRIRERFGHPRPRHTTSTAHRLERRSVTAGCVIEVPRRGTTRRHVILDIAYLNDLLEAQASETFGANIVAHELAHVAFLRQRKQPDWSFLVERKEWRTALLLELALPIWDEYAACRASAHVGNRFSVTAIFMNSLSATLSRGPPRLHLSTRKHWRVVTAGAAYVRAIVAARAPLLSAAYFIGHIDGLGIDMTVTALSTPARTSTLAPHWEPMRHALRNIWESSGWSAGAKDMHGLLPILLAAVDACGGARIFANPHNRVGAGLYAAQNRL